MTDLRRMDDHGVILAVGGYYHKGLDEPQGIYTSAADAVAVQFDTNTLGTRS